MVEHKLSRYDELHEQLQKHQQMLSQMQEAGLIEVDAQGNVSPSKQKPRPKFQDFDQQ